jgi:excisionase family DNA binding protein
MSGRISTAPKELSAGSALSPVGEAKLQSDSERRTVSVEQAGRILGISPGAAYAHAKDGSLPTIRLGKRLLVPKAALDKLLSVEVRDAR